MHSFYSKSLEYSGSRGKFQPLSIGIQQDNRTNSKTFDMIIKFGITKIIGTCSLFLMGAGLFLVGLYWLYVDHRGFIPMTFIGMICLVPGTYGMYEIIGTLRGWSGFQDISQLDKGFSDDDWTYSV
mmetsp:Transcript_5543/g.7653  ORF Transcript_5543/g.7653 Transcript_5543/m.7653 type:complete len:126 (+) Transcript_5543:52-429(+)